MNIHDISLTLDSGMVSYPKDVPYKRYLQRDLAKSDSSNVSVVEMSAHTGSHVDSPLHFLANGYGASEIPLSHLYGPAFVADCCGMAAVTAEVLKKQLPQGTKRLLLKTDNSQLLKDNPKGPFDTDFVYLDPGGAQYIADNGIELVGIDYLSIDKYGSSGKDSHHILLENNITILEGIVLAEVEAGEYFMACGALKMADADGAPCRVVLIEF